MSNHVQQYVRGLRVSTQSALIAATAVASAGLAIPGGARLLKLTNTGANKVYVSVSTQAGDVAVAAGAAFATKCIPVGLNETVYVDLESIAGGSLAVYISAVCAATETATLLVAAS